MNNERYKNDVSNRADDNGNEPTMHQIRFRRFTFLSPDCKFSVNILLMFLSIVRVRIRLLVVFDTLGSSESSTFMTEDAPRNRRRR